MGLTSCWEALALPQLPQPLGFALETPASISLGITKETQAQRTHSLLGHDQSAVPMPSWAVTTQVMFAGSTESPGILRGVPSLGASHRMAAEPTSARTMALPRPASSGVPCMRCVPPGVGWFVLGSAGKAHRTLRADEAGVWQARIGDFTPFGQKLGLCLEVSQGV